MCGIAGSFGVNMHMKRALELMHHRGPDRRSDEEGDDFYIGHTHLEIVSPGRSHQPFINEDGTIIAAVNGEIYNHMELRTILEERGHEFSTESDCEVLVHGYEEFGLDILKKMDGMFALAIYSTEEKKGIIARDRFGIKPLFFIQEPFIFASEIPPLLEYARREIDAHAIALYLRLRYIPPPYTPFRGIRAVMPGEAIIYRGGDIERVRWYSPRKGTRGSVLPHIRHSIKARTMGDAPMGVFLSGGIDSTAIAVMAQEERNFVAYTVDFGTGEEDAAIARRVCEDLGIKHRVLDVPSGAIDNIDTLLGILGMPLGDAAIIPTYLLSAMAAGEVKFVLTGEGADEIFGGYDYYFERARMLRLRRFIPRVMRSRRLANIIQRMPHFPGKRSLMMALSPSDGEVFSSLMGYFSPNEFSSFYKGDPLSGYIDSLHPSGGPLEMQMDIDMKMWLPGDLLVKLDTATMAASIEGRVPYLYHNLVETVLAYRGSERTSIAPDERKKLLKNALRDVIPPYVIERRKMGFDVPVEMWLSDDIGGLEEAIKTVHKRFGIEMSIPRRGDRNGWEKAYLVYVLGKWADVFL